MKLFLALSLSCALCACGQESSGGPTSDPQDSGDVDASGGGGDDDGNAAGDGAPGDDDQGDGVIDVPPVYPECAVLPLPESCGAAATTALAPDAYGTTGAHAVTVETFANPVPEAPADVSVYLPDGLDDVPVVFFGHAFGATKAAVYDDFYRMLASNGIAAVHVPYEFTGATNAARYSELWSGFTKAAELYADTFDMTRVAFAGHSFGGGATPEMARRGFVEEGWGSAGRFMFIMAPWYSWGTDYDTIPLDVEVVVQIYADDNVNDHTIALNDIWDRLPSGIDKHWVVYRSDVCDCGLNADHVVPMTGAQTGTSSNGERLNGLDRWGVDRPFMAMASYTWFGDADAYDIAVGVDGQMGNWVGCDGRAVRPLESTTTPELALCQSYVYPYTARCASADDDYVCP